MSDKMQPFIDALVAIKEDPELRKSIVDVLKFGAQAQQVRVSKILAEIEKFNPPTEVKNFVKLLSDDKLAHQVLTELS